MAQLTIRCHPCASVPIDELERWLELEVHDLRIDGSRGTVRLSRLTQSLPSGDFAIGWLLELELPEGDAPLERDRLAEALRDLRLLGLQTTLLVPHDLSDRTPCSSDGAAVAAVSDCTRAEFYDGDTMPAARRGRSG